jgi:hypothetical protein
MLTFAALAVLLSWNCQAGSSQNVSTNPQSKQDEILVQRILAGESAAIEEAGKSGNRLFIPYLRRELKDRKKEGDTVWHAMIALAQLGETDQMQEVWCRAITDDPKRGLENPIFELKQVGGWFGIQGLQKLLTPESLVHWHKLSDKEKYSDVSVDPLELSALKLLPTVIPNPPVTYSSPTEQFKAQTHTREEIKMWQDWIAAHKDELRKLQPTGEGVDFSPNACKNGKPRKKQQPKWRAGDTR